MPGGQSAEAPGPDHVRPLWTLAILGESLVPRPTAAFLVILTLSLNSEQTTLKQVFG